MPGPNGTLEVLLNASQITTRLWTFSDGTGEIRISKTGGPLYLPLAVSPPIIPAIESKKLLIVGTWRKETDGSYVLMVEDERPLE
jgi:hypothetical protein